MKHVVKFSSQAEKKVLEVMKKLAEAQGRKLQDLIDEAFKDYIEKTRTGKPRKHVMEAFEQSLLTYDKTYSKLAK